MSEDVAHSSSPAWDSREIGRPSVLRLGTALWLFYSGCDSSFEWKIGLAHSSDGAEWQRFDDSPLLVASGRRASGGPHSYLAPTAVQWPAGSDRLLLVCVEVGDGPGSRLVSFESANAVSWSGPTALRLDGSLAMPGLWLASPWLVVLPDGLELFGVASTTDGTGITTSRIFSASSADGRSWHTTEDSLPWSGDLDHPCVARGPDGELRLWCSEFSGNEWRILTSHSTATGWAALEQIATVADSPWESAGIFAPCVLAAEDGYLMWHLSSSRTSDGMATAMFMRRSADGRTWSRVSAAPVLRPRPGIPVRPW